MMLLERLSDRVFETVVDTLQARRPPVRCERLETSRLEPGALRQYSTAIELDPRYVSAHPPNVCWDAFETAIRYWGQHRHVYIVGRLTSEGLGLLRVDADAPPTLPSALADVTVMQPLPRPTHTLWSQSYEDDETGAIMRAIADWRVDDDQVVLRWDLLCG
jgi:hypothetical protein